MIQVNLPGPGGSDSVVRPQGLGTGPVGPHKDTPAGLHPIMPMIFLLRRGSRGLTVLSLFAVALLLWMATWPGAGAARAQDFLPADEAFQVVMRQAASGDLQAEFRVAPGTYLYRERMEARWAPDGT